MKAILLIGLAALVAGDGDVHHHPHVPMHVVHTTYAAPPSPSPLYGAPVPPPSTSYGVPSVPEGPYGSSESSSGSSSSEEHTDGSYQPPVVPAGPYGESSGGAGSHVIHVPGVPVTTEVHTQYYAPFYTTQYKPVEVHVPAPVPTYGAPVPAPSPSYGAPPPPPSSSYGVPEVPAGPYAPPTPVHVAVPVTSQGTPVVQAGNALVRSWLTQTSLQGGGTITETKVPDGHGGYKTETTEEWQDSPPEYKYSYDITGSPGDTSAQESRSGGKTTGRYTVKQPDGKTRIVEYTVDEWGFKPTVTFV